MAMKDIGTGILLFFGILTAVLLVIMFFTIILFGLMIILCITFVVIFVIMAIFLLVFLFAIPYYAVTKKPEVQQHAFYGLDEVSDKDDWKKTSVEHKKMVRKKNND